MCTNANGRLSPNPWMATNNAVTHDSSASKIGGVSAWDSAVYSLNAYTTAHIQGKINPVNSSLMVGLTTTPPPISGNSSYSSMGYSWYSTALPTWQIYEGVTYQGTFGASTITDVNPALRGFALGELKAVKWKSFDGMEIWGLLLTPSGAPNAAAGVRNLTSAVPGI